MAPWWTDQTSHGCSRQLLSPAAALLVVVSPNIPHASLPRVLQRRRQQRPEPWVIADSLLRASALTHALRIENAPDKPAFLSGSGRAAPFLSLPFCPGQRMMGCQRGIWGFQIRYTVVPLPSTPPIWCKQWADANNKLKVGARYVRAGPAFKITLGEWVIMNWGRTINSRLGYVTLQPFTVQCGSDEAKLSWCVWGGYYFRQKGWKPGVDQSLTRQCQ